MKTIAIIGAGPAGMMAALQAAGTERRILLFEANDRVGRKLLLTGSGRCNISNRFVAAERYSCADSIALSETFTLFGHTELIDYLGRLAIPVYSTEDGWCYPLSQSASAVVDTLSTALNMAGVELHLGCKIIDVRKKDDRFALYSEKDIFYASKVIFASGGVSHPQTGSKGECFPILKRFGHTIIPHRPALAPVIADVKALHKLQGVRLDAAIHLYQDKRLVAETKGNIIITQWGLNGPGIMDISHHIKLKSKHECYLMINFISQKESILQEMFSRFQGTEWPLRILLQAVLPFKAPPVFMRLSGIPPEITMAEVTREQIQHLVKQLISFRMTVNGTKGFDWAQSSAGGVPFTEIDPKTMQSRKVSGLYLTGEVLDVVGPCGGYNLQFAFSSGALAGQHAGISL